MTFGKELKKIRLKHNRTQKFMALQFDMSATSYYQIENDNLSARSKLLHSILDNDYLSEEEQLILSEKYQEKVDEEWPEEDGKRTVRETKAKQEEADELSFGKSPGRDLKKLGRLITEKRRRYKLNVREAAKIAGVSQAHFTKHENNKVKNWSEGSQKILDRFLLKELEVKEVINRNEDFLIKNIPDFYERLADLEGEDGSLSGVDKNHSDLQELRMMVGGRKVMTSGN